MDQSSFLPFSSIVASILLYKRRVTGVEIINFISLLSQENIFISDESDEEMDNLMMCVDCRNYDYFEIKNNLDYDSYLFEEVTVKEFLYSKASIVVLEFINKTDYLQKSDFLNNDKLVLKKERRELNFFHKFLILGDKIVKIKDVFYLFCLYFYKKV